MNFPISKNLQYFYFHHQKLMILLFTRFQANLNFINTENNIKNIYQYILSPFLLI